MPGFDRTGPEGKGAKTGRGMGKCNPQKDVTDETRSGKGLGRGQGQGKGRGRGRGKGMS